MLVNQSAQAEKVLGYAQLVGVATSTGFAAINGGSIPDGTEFAAVRFIEQVAGAELNCTFYGR